MHQWLSGFSNIANTDQIWLTQLVEYLTPLEGLLGLEGHAGIGRAIFEYVATGLGDEILQQIGAIKIIAGVWRLSGYSYGEVAPDALYQNFAQVSPAIALRWAKVLTASLSELQQFGTRSDYNLPLADNTHWPEVLLLHSMGYSVTGHASHIRHSPYLSYAVFESLLLADQRSPAAFLFAGFLLITSRRFGAERHFILTRFADFSAAVARHALQLQPLFTYSGQVQQRVHVLQMLDFVTPDTLAHFVQPLCEAATGSSKQLRDCAQRLLDKNMPAMLACLRDMAKMAKPTQRAYALMLLKQHADKQRDTELLQFVMQSASADQSQAVQKFYQEWQPLPAQPAKSANHYEVPVIDWSVALTPALVNAIDALWQNVNQAIDDHNAQCQQAYLNRLARGANYPFHPAVHWAEEHKQALLAYLHQTSALPDKPSRQPVFIYQNAEKCLPKLMQCTDLSLLAWCKILYFTDLLRHEQNAALQYHMSNWFNRYYQQRGPCSLLELALILEGLGVTPLSVLRSCYMTNLADQWQPEHVWPFFVHYEEIFGLELLANTPENYWRSREELFKYIPLFPQLPIDLTHRLYDLAFGTAKLFRTLAQQSLHQHPERDARIIAALGASKADVRSQAANWATRLKLQPAKSALVAALQNEKNDGCKAALLDALQMLGDPISHYLDRNLLAAEGIKLMQKGLPNELEWLAWQNIPVMHWADNQQPVALQATQYLILRAFKQKTPVPDAILRKYCEMITPQQRNQFATWLLEQWIAEDLKPAPPDPNQTIDNYYLEKLWMSIYLFPSCYRSHPLRNPTREELVQYYTPLGLQSPAGSAINSKGILAICAACAGNKVVEIAWQYLKTFYGLRAAQGRALIQMLAWVELPAATQLLLSIGNRFRTRGIQEEAHAQILALAERRGWTMDELADRTIPSAMLDERGQLTLSYGQRVFTAELTEDASLRVHTAEGHIIANLPEPRQEEDAEAAKQAKKQLSDAKKELKTVIKLQTDRLYAALCTERTWQYQDWQVYLQQHPIMRLLIQRLVWLNVTQNISFRPLNDNTLSDFADNQVTAHAHDLIRLAHDSLLSAADIAAWQQHLIDYQIIPLFVQLGKGYFTLSAAQQEQPQLEQFKGYLLEAYTLRNWAKKLDYIRGSTEDGGWFYRYEKNFSSPNLLAAIEFTGNQLPEENRTVALLNLSFCDSRSRQNIALSKVPKVLLSECYFDIKQIADQGSGFDPDWQAKTEY